VIFRPDRTRLRCRYRSARRPRVSGLPGPKAQLFNLQWLAYKFGRLILLLFTEGSRRRLFINRLFFEQ
jgi:hypothetical protein